MSTKFLFICFASACLAPQLLAQEPWLDPIYDVQIQRDVAYAVAPIKGGSETLELTLDLYEPTGPAIDRPAIMLIHGGSFTSGNKSNMSQLATDYASRGYVAASIRYRLEGDGIFEEGPAWNNLNVALNDAGRGVSWMRENAETLNIDPNRIAAGGYSAGAITALFLGFHDPTPGVAAVVSLAGGMYGSESIIDADDTPTFLLHGAQDTVVPFSQAEAIQSRAIEVGLPLEVQFVSDGTHDAVSLLSREVDEMTIMEHSVVFLNNHLNVSELTMVPGIEQTIVSAGETWSYQGGLSAAERWNESTFDDSSWTEGIDGFGHGRRLETRGLATEVTDMKDNYTSLYLRKGFDVDLPNKTTALMLDIDYEDAFVAYINGVEVTRANVSVGEIPDDAVAESRRVLTAAGRHFINLADVPALDLEESGNVLAIRGISSRLSDSRFLMSNISLNRLISPDVGDCNEDGTVTAEDLSCLTAVTSRDVVLETIESYPGDLNGDGQVVFEDFLILSANFGNPNGEYIEGNIDLQGGIDFADFLALASNYERTRTEATSAVPEPTTRTELFIALAAFYFWRSNKKVRSA